MTLYHEYVKHSKQPPETKNQFCIPAEWIKTLDPRIKEKIRTETRADMEAKGKIEIEKINAEINKCAGKLYHVKVAFTNAKANEKEKLKAKADFDKAEEKKQVFLKMLENRIQNEIAKRIDRAHNYSFNFANYKSTISDSQLVEWTDALKHIQPNGVTAVEEVYKKLSNSKPENILPYLVKLNPNNALEADIAREYVSNLDNELITKHKELNVIKGILKSGAKYPTVSIKETCTYEKGKLATQATEEGVFPFVVTAKERKTAPEYQFDTKAVCIPLISSTGHGSATLSRIHYQEGKFALANLLFAAIPNNPDTELYPQYLYYILDARREALFCPLMKGTANVSMKMEDAVNVRFPLPDIEIQKQIVDQIEKQKAIIEGAEKVIKNYEVDEHIFSDFEKKKLSEVAYLIMGQSPRGETYNENGIGSILINGPTEFGKGSFDNPKKIKWTTHPTKMCCDHDLLICVRGATTGRTNIASFEACIGRGIAAVRAKDRRSQKYINYYLNCYKNRILGIAFGAMFPNLTSDQLNDFEIAFPLPDEQEIVIKQINSQIQVIDGLVVMKAEAEKKINKILADVWGVEYVEPKENNAESEEE